MLIGNGEFYNGDCLDVMRGLPDNSVDMVLTDPPYYRVKNESWDRQWADPTKFLAWLDEVLAQTHRLLKPNGSLYMFASPQMASRVEILVSGRFDVLNNIRWHKDGGWHKKSRKEDLRSYLTPWEAVIFAEHQGAEAFTPKGQVGYRGEMDRLRASIFAPLRSYLNDELSRSGLNRNEVNEMMGFAPQGMAASRYFGSSQWSPPTASHYKTMQTILQKEGTRPDILSRSYESFRDEFTALQREFDREAERLEPLRRRFAVTADTAHTDLWTFDPVGGYPGKHPCEKPQTLLQHILSASSRESDVILDPFMGSGTTAIAAERSGRRWIGIERDEGYYNAALARIWTECAA